MNNIPFILIECGPKAEYRDFKCQKDHPDEAIRKLARSIRIYTAGAEYSPFRIGPCALEGNVSVAENIERLLLNFEASIPIQGSISAILGEAIEKLYRDCADPYTRPPRMRDLLRAVKQVLAGKDYSADIKSDLTTAINNRLGVLTRRLMGYIFNCRKSTPSIEQLVTGNTIIELFLLSSTQQALLVFILLTGICQYVKTTPFSGKGPRLIIFLEEAGSVIGPSTDARASETNADPKAFASELIANRMLGQLRAEKIGLVILNQTSTSIAIEVLRNVGTKIACGVDESDEREAAAGAMLFGDIEKEDIARLKPGGCYYITEGYSASRKLKCPDVKKLWNMPQAPKANGIIDFIMDERWFIDDMNTVVAAELSQLKTDMDIFNDYLRTFIDKIAMIKTSGHSINDNEKIKKFRKLYQHINDSFDTFISDSYEPLTRTMMLEDVVESTLVEKRATLITQFETIIKPAVDACIATLKRSIKKLDKYSIDIEESHYG